MARGEKNSPRSVRRKDGNRLVRIFEEKNDTLMAEHEIRQCSTMTSKFTKFAFKTYNICFYEIQTGKNTRD